MEKFDIFIGKRMPCNDVNIILYRLSSTVLLPVFYKEMKGSINPVRVSTRCFNNSDLAF